MELDILINIFAWVGLILLLLYIWLEEKAKRSRRIKRFKEEHSDLVECLKEKEELSSN